MTVSFARPKLATRLPPERMLTADDFKRLHQEARVEREALDVHAARVERLPEDDWKLRVR